MKRIAVIVIGSNSTRLLAADAVDQLTNPVRGRVETRLFLGMNSAAAFDEQSMAHTVESVNQLKLEAESTNAELIGVYATSAARDASNTDVLARKILKSTGHALQILSGEEEAAYSFFGAAGNETCGVIDIGGGSTEIVLGSGTDLFATHSLQMGASRLFKTHPINSVGDCSRAFEAIKSSMNDLPAVFKRFASPMSFYLLGGTGTACARMLAKPPEGCILSNEQLDRLLHLVAETPRDNRKYLPGFPASRVDILPTGMAILSVLFEIFSIGQVCVTERTNADGLLRAYIHKKFS